MLHCRPHLLYVSITYLAYPLAIQFHGVHIIRILFSCQAFPLLLYMFVTFFKAAQSPERAPSSILRQCRPTGVPPSLMLNHVKLSLGAGEPRLTDETNQTPAAKDGGEGDLHHPFRCTTPNARLGSMVAELAMTCARTILEDDEAMREEKDRARISDDPWATGSPAWGQSAASRFCAPPSPPFPPSYFPSPTQD